MNGVPWDRVYPQNVIITMILLNPPTKVSRLGKQENVKPRKGVLTSQS